MKTAKLNYSTILSFILWFFPNSRHFKDINFEIINKSIKIETDIFKGVGLRLNKVFVFLLRYFFIILILLFVAYDINFKLFFKYDTNYIILVPYLFAGLFYLLFRDISIFKLNLYLSFIIYLIIIFVGFYFIYDSNDIVFFSKFFLSTIKTFFIVYLILESIRDFFSIYKSDFYLVREKMIILEVDNANKQ